MLATIPAAIHFFPKPCASAGVAVQYESGWKRDAPVSHFVLQVEAHAQVETCFTRAACLQRRGGGRGVFDELVCLALGRPNLAALELVGMHAEMVMKRGFGGEGLRTQEAAQLGLAFSAVFRTAVAPFR